MDTTKITHYIRQHAEDKPTLANIAKACGYSPYHLSRRFRQVRGYTIDSVSDADRVFAALSEGGTVLYPLEKQVWEAYDGRCIDRFGTAWEVMY